MRNDSAEAIYLTWTQEISITQIMDRVVSDFQKNIIANSLN